MDDIYRKISEAADAAYAALSGGGIRENGRRLVARYNMERELITRAEVAQRMVQAAHDLLLDAAELIWPIVDEHLDQMAAAQDRAEEAAEAAAEAALASAEHDLF